MESIVHFMYLGETTFYDDKMKDLLAVARNLQIKQMCDTIVKEENQKDFYQNEKDLNIKEWQVPSEEEVSANDEGNWKVPIQLFNDTTREHVDVEMNENKINIGNNNYLAPQASNGYQCPEFKYTSNRKSNVRQHIMSIHEGQTYPCNLCKCAAQLKLIQVTL